MSSQFELTPVPGSGSGTPPAGVERSLDSMFDMVYSVSQTVLGLQNLAPKLDSLQQTCKELNDSVVNVRQEVVANETKNNSRLSALEQSVSALQKRPAHNSTAPNTQGNSLDKFEIKFRGWPPRLEKSIATLHVQALLDTHDIPAIVGEIRGKFVDFVPVSFESLTDKLTFMSDIKQSGNGLVVTIDDLPVTLKIQNIVPPHIKVQSDIVKHVVWHLRNEVMCEQSENIEHEPQYREITFHSQPIAFYIDSGYQQVFGKSGGTFCIDGSVLKGLLEEHEIVFDISKLQQYVQQKFRDREIILK